MPGFIDLTGQKFGRLTVIREISKEKRSRRKWLCKCDCKNNNEVIVRGDSLRGGSTRSCGCLQPEIASAINTKHSHASNGKRTKTHNSWHMMIQRCTNPNYNRYKDYGGRGIAICEEWLEFSNFLKDMGKRPPGYTLERRGNERGYCPENCYWATRKQQQRNTRRNHLIIHERKTQCVSAWAEETGISKNTILWRLNHGWSTERALTTPVGKEMNKNDRAYC